MTEFLFVYGTLRSEFPHPLAKRLSTQAKLIGKGSTPGLLYDFGWYPGAKFDAGARTHVIGEVFSLKNAARLLAELDHYEGTAEPGNAFRRVPVKVRLDRGRHGRCLVLRDGRLKGAAAADRERRFHSPSPAQGPKAGAGLTISPPLRLYLAEQAAKRSGSGWNAR